MCRAYACDLLTGVEEGTVSRQDAEEVRRQALRLRDQVRPALESLTTRSPVPVSVPVPVPVVLSPPATPAGRGESGDCSPPPVKRINRRSIPGMRNALAGRVGETDRDALPREVRSVLDDTDELMALLRDRFGLGR
jgi:hypothetical protein